MIEKWTVLILQRSLIIMDNHSRKKIGEDGKGKLKIDIG